MVEEYFEFLDLIGNQGIGILHADSTFSPRWNATIEMERTDCRGDLSFMTNVSSIKDLVLKWSWNKKKSYLPKSADHIPDENEDFGRILRQCYKFGDIHKLTKTCFVAEEVEDNEEMRDDVNEGVIDEPDADEDNIHFLQPDEVAKIKEYDEELLAKIPLPGAPKEETERRKKWLKIPQKARLAILVERRTKNGDICHEVFSRTS